MNRYQLIRLGRREDADDYAAALPKEAKAKVVPCKWCGKQMFAVDVLRTYAGGRI